jgi:hypothetical protein
MNVGGHRKPAAVQDNMISLLEGRSLSPDIGYSVVDWQSDSWPDSSMSRGVGRRDSVDG